MKFFIRSHRGTKYLADDRGHIIIKNVRLDQIKDLERYIKKKDAEEVNHEVKE